MNLEEPQTKPNWNTLSKCDEITGRHDLRYRKVKELDQKENNGI
jgi:hypothetical protein